MTIKPTSTVYFFYTRKLNPLNQFDNLGQGRGPLIMDFLDSKNYSKFGKVLCSKLFADHSADSANQGTAQKLGHLVNFIHPNPKAKLNLSLYQVAAQILPGQKEFLIKLLERHQHSPQVFCPIQCSSPYLVIVALGDSEPDLSTLRAFWASPDQAISYHAGVWHHPLIAGQSGALFLGAILEDQSPADCEEFPFQQPHQISLSD